MRSRERGGVRGSWKRDGAGNKPMELKKMKTFTWQHCCSSLSHLSVCHCVCERLWVCASVCVCVFAFVPLTVPKRPFYHVFLSTHTHTHSLTHTLTYVAVLYDKWLVTHRVFPPLPLSHNFLPFPHFPFLRTVAHTPKSTQHQTIRQVADLNRYRISDQMARIKSWNV